MKINDEELQKQERLGALLDGESPDPRGDLSWVKSDPDLLRRYQQYRQMRELVNTLEDPAPPPGFAAGVIARVSAPRRVLVPSYAYALAAGVMVVLGAFCLYLLAPVSPEAVPAPALIARDDAAGLLLPADPYAESWPPAADVPDSFELDEPMAALEGLSGEEVINALAVLTVVEDAAAPEWTGEEVSQAGQESWAGAGDGTTFVELLDFVDTLDAAEADVLNLALRAALEDA